MSKTLRAIDEDLKALDELLEEVGGDVSDVEAEQAVDNWLVENRRNLHEKLDGYAEVIESKESKAKRWQTEAKRLQDLAQVEENAVARMKNRLAFFLNEWGEKKIETEFHKITLAGNGGKAPLQLMPPKPAGIAVEDPALRPYIRTVHEYDPAAVREALEAGKELGWAKITPRGFHVRIK
jgi:hypothetical protein